MTKLVLLSLAVLAVPFAHAKESVSAAIVLAVDVSLSVSDTSSDPEYVTQKKGVAAALRDPEVRQLLETCNPHGVAITYVEWAGEIQEDSALQVVGWHHVRNGGDLNLLADKIEAVPKRTLEGYTDIAGALRFASQLVKDSAFTAERKVISISGDGVQNVPRNHENQDYTDQENIDFVSFERNRLVNEGFVIDGLTIMNDEAMKSLKIDLLEYYRQNVIGGTGHMLEEVMDYNQYSQGMRKILLRELDACSF